MSENLPGYSLSPVGIMRTPFKQKFAIPRQPNLAGASGRLEFSADFTDPACLKGIEGYSHLWVLFLFHETLPRGWQNTVRAPRLGGNATLGVFATRSTHRPNGIGMSVVKNEGIISENGRLILHVKGVDLLDGTPVVDIKPYLPYADSIADATDPLTGYAPIPSREVRWHPDTATARQELAGRFSDAITLTETILAQDPRPAYRQSDENDPKVYKVALYDVDISWQVSQGVVIITALEPQAG